MGGRSFFCSILLRAARKKSASYLGATRVGALKIDDDDMPKVNQAAAQAAARKGRELQLMNYDADVKGEKVDFKNHQGTSHFETYDPSVYSKPKTTKLRFMNKYKFFDAVLNSDADLGEMIILNCV